MIDEMLVKGILTLDPIRRYPLTASSLAVVKKLYALENFIGYSLNFSRLEQPDRAYYLTYEGLLWFYERLKSYSLAYLRSTFSPFFMLNDAPIESMESLNNFRGLCGDRPRAGSKQSAVVVHKYKRVSREYFFERLYEAREFILTSSRFYPLDDFKLYRVRKQTRKGKLQTFREELPVITGMKK